MEVNLVANASTDQGKVRRNNQDAFLCRPKSGLFIVADGMGGHAGGDIASAMCVAGIEAYLPTDSTTPRTGNDRLYSEASLLECLDAAIKHASTKIYRHAVETPSLRGMGTTATVLQISGEHAHIAHVGDSRLYRVCDNGIEQLTTDHSWVNEQVLAGEMTIDEAAIHPMRNVITRCVGLTEKVNAETKRIRLRHRDHFVLCSDGLTKYVSDAEIAQFVLEADTTPAVDKLITCANQRGGNDNITVVTVKV